MVVPVDDGLAASCQVFQTNNAAPAKAMSKMEIIRIGFFFMRPFSSVPPD